MMPRTWPSRLQRELSATFHCAADPVVRLASPPDELLRQAVRYRRRRGDSETAGLWRLDTGAPGTTLLAGPRLLPEVVGPDDVQDALLTPDGQHIIASVTYDSLSHVKPGEVIGGIVQLSAQTGQPPRPASRCRPCWPSAPLPIPCPPRPSRVASSHPSTRPEIICW
jgi:hypothetical protein